MLVKLYIDIILIAASRCLPGNEVNRSEHQSKQFQLIAIYISRLFPWSKSHGFIIVQ